MSQRRSMCYQLEHIFIHNCSPECGACQTIPALATEYVHVYEKQTTICDYKI